MTESPPAGTFAARHFDHDTPLGQEAQVTVVDSGLTVRLANETQLWPFEQLRQPRVPRRGEAAHLERRGVGETLVFRDAAILGAIRRAAPSAGVRAASGVSFMTWVAILFVALAASLILLFTVGIPALATSVARSIPPEWEARFGDAMVEQVAPAAKRLRDPRVQTGMSRIVSRLARPGAQARYRVFAVDGPEVNAFAAPGGTIVVYRGMIEFSKSPEELAGVIAHEMAHVRERHVMENVLKRASLGVLVGLALGDVSGPAAIGVQMAKTLGELSFSREAEIEADRVALAMLAQAGIDARPFPDVLERLGSQAKSPEWAAFLSTHPAPQGRARELRARILRERPPEPTPLMSAAEWTAMREGASPPRK